MKNHITLSTHNDMVMEIKDCVQKAKKFIQLIEFDLSTFFYTDYEEINSEEMLGTFMIDYEKKLPKKEFDFFDLIRFRVFSDKSNITGTNHINVTFRSEQKENPEQLVVENIINQLSEIFGEDDNKKGGWSNEDIEEYKLKITNRAWTLGKDDKIYSINLIFHKEEGFILNILFYTNLLKLTGSL